MNIGQLLGYALQSNGSGRAPTTASTQTGDVLTQAIKKANASLQSRVDTTTARLSSFGKLQSAMSDAQVAAQGLMKLSTTASASDVKAAAEKFVAAYNGTLGTAQSTATTSSGQTREGLTAARMGRELGRGLSNNAELRTALKQQGITVQSNGTLKLEARTFDAAREKEPSAVLKTLAKLGKLADLLTGNELATGGGIGKSMASLSQEANGLKSQQSKLLVTALNASGSNNRSPNAVSQALAAYRGV